MTLRNTTLLALLMVCGFLVVGQLYVVIALAPDIGARYCVDAASAALAGTAFGLAYAAGFLVFGPLSDRHGRKRVIVAGLAAMALATWLVGLAHGFALLLAARALQGLAASTFAPAALALVAHDLPPHQRAFGVSLLSFAFLGAAPLAQFLATQSGAGLPDVMFALAPLYLMGGAAIHCTMAGRGAQEHKPGGPDGLGETHMAWFGDAGMRAAWAAATTVLFGFVCLHAGAQALGPSLAADLQTLRLAGLPPLALSSLAAAPLMRRNDPAPLRAPGCCSPPARLAWPPPARRRPCWRQAPHCPPVWRWPYRA